MSCLCRFYVFILCLSHLICVACNTSSLFSEPLKGCLFIIGWDLDSVRCLRRLLWLKCSFSVWLMTLLSWPKTCDWTVLSFSYLWALWLIGGGSAEMSLLRLADSCSFLMCWALWLIWLTDWQSGWVAGGHVESVPSDVNRTQSNQSESRECSRDSKSNTLCDSLPISLPLSLSLSLSLCMYCMYVCMYVCSYVFMYVCM